LHEDAAWRFATVHAASATCNPDMGTMLPHRESGLLIIHLNPTSSTQKASDNLIGDKDKNVAAGCQKIASGLS
jgi:hypothetical protein